MNAQELVDAVADLVVSWDEEPGSDRAAEIAARKIIALVLANLWAAERATDRK